MKQQIEKLKQEIEELNQELSKLSDKQESIGKQIKENHAMQQEKRTAIIDLLQNTGEGN